jgi:DNA repair protein RadC
MNDSRVLKNNSAVNNDGAVNTLIFSAALAHDKGTLRNFLSAAIAFEQPTIERLTANGIAHYDAALYARRLHDAGEWVAFTWTPAARTGYQALLEKNTDAEKSEKNSTSRLARMHEHDRPREKALHSGVQMLSDQELMALLLRTGIPGDCDVMELAERLLSDYDGILGLSRTDLAILLSAHGLGPAKATEIAAAFELAKRVAQSQRRRERPILKSPEDTAAYMRETVLLDHERFWCLPLDSRSQLIGEPRQISQGDVDGTDAGPRAFFRSALAVGATSCIAVHNHPTGDPSPSNADRTVTTRLYQAGRIIDVRLVDHLILGDGGKFVSLRRDCPELFR